MELLKDKDRHGGPYDRGGADSYYGRGFNPHYYLGATYSSARIEIDPNVDSPELKQYEAGFYENEEAEHFKDWR